MSTQYVSSDEAVQPQPASRDVEKQVLPPDAGMEGQGRTSESSATRLINEVLARGRVEGRGIVPLPVEERISTRYFNVFTIWFSMNTNILAWVSLCCQYAWRQAMTDFPDQNHFWDARASLRVESERLIACHSLFHPSCLASAGLSWYPGTQDWDAADDTSQIQFWVR